MRIKALNHDWLKKHLADIISITYYAPAEPESYWFPEEPAEIEADIYVDFFKKIKLNTHVGTFIEGEDYLTGERYKVVNGYIPMPCDFYDDAVKIAEDNAESEQLERQISLEVA